MLLIDTHNLFYTSTQQYNCPVDYQKLVEFLVDRYNDPFNRRFAYVNSTARNFANFLRTKGFVVRSKDIRSGKTDNFDVELTLDALDYDDRRVIICSSSPNLVALIQALNDNCVSVGVHSFGIPYVVRQACYTEELPRHVLRDGVVAA